MIPMAVTTDVLEIARARDLARSGTGRTIRVSAGLSLSEVGQAVGIAPSTVLRYERGQRMPRGEPGVAWARLMTQLLNRSQS